MLTAALWADVPSLIARQRCDLALVDLGGRQRPPTVNDARMFVDGFRTHEPRIRIVVVSPV